jgi:6-phosphofructokinase 2
MSHVITLTMNPAVDVSTSTRRLQPRAKLRCAAGRRDPGGGGVNVARVLHELGMETLAIFPAGGIVGQHLRQLLAAEGLGTRVIPIAGETREVFNVVEEESGDQFRFLLPGPRLHGAEWMACLKALSHCERRPQVICASGSLPPGAPADFYARVAEVASSLGARFVLDTAGPPLRAALEHGLYLIKPNLAELAELTGAALGDETAQLAACRGLIARGRVQAVALTLGAEGALFVTAGGAWRARPVTVHPMTSVGAGDAFLGGLIAGLAQGGHDPSDALRLATAAGVAAVLAPGTELCRAADVRRLQGQITVERLREAVAAGA